MIVTAHFPPFQFLNSNFMHVHACTVSNTRMFTAYAKACFMLSRCAGIKIQVLSSLCSVKHLKSGYDFVQGTHTCILTVHVLAVLKWQGMPPKENS